MRTSRVTGRLLAAALAGSVALSLTGCAGSVQGRAWPEGQGPPVPAAAPAPESTGSQDPADRAPPTSFTVPAPLGPGVTSPEPPGSRPPPPAPTPVPPPPATPGPGSGTPGGAAATRTVPPVPVGPTSEVPDGRPRPSAAAPTTGDSPPPRTTIPAAPDTGTPGTRAPAPARPVAAAPLTADVLPDECLVPAAALAGLLGTRPAAPAANAEVGRADGSRARSCFAVGGSATVSVNVYTTNLTTPAGYVRAAAGSRPLGGTGEGTTAALLETVGGPALQLGTDRHLMTIAVAGRTPSDEQWRAAARSAAAALTR